MNDYSKSYKIHQQIGLFLKKDEQDHYQSCHLKMNNSTIRNKQSQLSRMSSKASKQHTYQNQLKNPNIQKQVPDFYEKYKLKLQEIKKLPLQTIVARQAAQIDRCGIIHDYIAQRYNKQIYQILGIAKIENQFSFKDSQDNKANKIDGQLQQNASIERSSQRTHQYQGIPKLGLSYKSQSTLTCSHQQYKHCQINQQNLSLFQNNGQIQNYAGKHDMEPQHNNQEIDENLYNGQDEVMYLEVHSSEYSYPNQHNRASFFWDLSNNEDLL